MKVMQLMNTKYIQNVKVDTRKPKFDYIRVSVLHIYKNIEAVKKVIPVVELYSDLITCLVLIAMFRKYN